MTVVQDIKSRTDIVEVVSGYVALQKAGRNFKANCPFHMEKTPSFIVFPERQSWRCFGGCATGGDAIAFVMKAENQDFAQALEHLAQRAGIAIPTRQPREKEGVLHQVNQATVELFQKVLHSPEGERAREYLEKRGVNQEALSTFQLGLSPSGWDTLTKHLTGRGFQAQDILAAGVALKDDKGNMRDLFHRRLMFPIRDTAGQVAGFGGRTLDGSNPKYLNTPRTPAFDKGRILYGLPMARGAISGTGVAVVVEGYMDAIAAHQHGFHNVVASMGTAITEHQVSALKSLASTFVLALDPDSAGQEATLRSLESSWQALQIDFLRAGGKSGVVFNQRHLSASLKIATLPPGKDPDVLIRESPEEWERLVSEAKPFLDYLFEALPPRFDLTDDEGKLQLVDSLSFSIRAERNPFTQRRYMRRLADIVKLSEADVEARVGRPQERNPQRRQRGETTPRAGASPLGATHRDLREEYCIHLLLLHPELRERGLDIPPDCFELSENRDVFTRWTVCSTMEEVQESLPEGLAEHLQAILATESPPLDRKARERALEEAVNLLKERFFKVQGQALLEQLEGADWEDISSLEPSLRQSNEINRQLRELFSGSSPATP
ncbi:MAG: primase [Dehalococcoidia bacterium]|nr:primase [Dehalococcoidia bacterium]